MNLRIRRFFHSFVILALTCLISIALVYLCYISWQQNSRLRIDKDHIYKVVFTPRSKTRPGINTITIDSKVLGRNPGSLAFSLRRVSLGTTEAAYTWDWKGVPVQSDFSFIDMTKLIRQDGLVTSWDINVEKAGILRLKVWRDLGEQWKAVVQSDKVVAAAGLNHFILKNPLPVRQGDYLGLYTVAGTIKLVSAARLGGISLTLVNQQPSDIEQAKVRGMQFNFPGDEDIGFKVSSVAAPNPGYAFRINLSALPVQEAICRAQPGRFLYKFEMPDQAFAMDEQVELSIEARGQTQAFIYPHLLWRLSGPHSYIGLESGTAFKSADVHTVSRFHWQSIFDFIIILLTIVSGFFMFRTRRRLLDAAIIIFSLFAAVMVWAGWVKVSPILQSIPAVLVILFFPGYVILELVLPDLASKIGSLERPPLLFGLSLAIWTIIAIPSYWAQWNTTWVIAGMLAACLLGAMIIVRFRPVHSVLSSVPDRHILPFPLKRVYLVFLAAVLSIVAVIIGFRSQFIRADFDTVDHLAGFQRIAILDRIIGGNPFLGAGSTALPHYASNPWYLAFGLTARLANIEVFWLYSILAAVLTILAFMSFLCLLNILMDDIRIAIMGTFLAVMFSLYGLSVDWAGIHSFYLEFMPYPSTLDQLILWPLTLFCVFRYLRFKDMNSWVLTALVALAALGQHILFTAWIVGITSLMLGVILFLHDFSKKRLYTLALIMTIILSAAVVALFMIKFPLTGHMKQMTSEEIVGWVKLKGMSFYSNALYSADIQYLLKEVWKQIFGFVVIILCTYGLGKRERKQHLLPQPGKDLLIVAGFALFGPYLIVFNPFIVPWICKLFNWPQVIYRWTNLTTMPDAIVYGALGCILVLFFQAKGKWSRVFQILPLFILFIVAVYPFFNKTLGKTLVSALDNRGWYPSVFDLANDPLYQGLRRLEPGVVAIERSRTGYIAALTHHYLVAGHYNTNSVIFSIEDAQTLAKRWADNEKILGFEITAQEMHRLLDEYRCRYVVVSRGSARLDRFKSYPDLFDTILETETDFLFSVKRS